jgi:hypothetical protein
MNSPSLKPAAEITSLAVQFLVDDLSEAITYYRDRLGFEPDLFTSRFMLALVETAFRFI